LAAGLAVGAAGALKLFAWPVAVVLVAWAATRGRRHVAAAAVPALAVPVAALLPAFLVERDAVMENVVRFPLGRGLVTTPAQSPLIGRLIAEALPGGRLIALALLGLTAIAVGGWLLRRPPRDARHAAAVCAVGLGAAIVLAPSTRFGYSLYPFALLLWMPGLARPSGRRGVDRTDDVP
jgi:hypothetical protein